MKKIRDFIADDMFNHISMSGPDIEKYFDPASGMTLADKLAYDKGIMCTYPFMMLGNYCNFKYDEEDPAPRDYEAFKAEAMPRLQAQVFPLLEPCFDDANPLPESERGKVLIPILTDIIPNFVLGEFYRYMYPDGEDIQPLLDNADKEIVLDCTDLEYISSSGLRIFLAVLKNAKAKGSHVFIRNINEGIQKVFKMTGFYNLFEFK